MRLCSSCGIAATVAAPTTLYASMPAHVEIDRPPDQDTYRNGCLPLADRQGRGVEIPLPKEKSPALVSTCSQQSR